MTRTVPAALQSHLDGATTSTATLWRITRQDGVVLRFTDHDADITFGGDVYKAAVGYQRTDISGSATLSVDSLDVQGILNSSKISETDLRGGRYDYAAVRIALVNWADPDGDGEVSLRTGWFGEILFDETSQSFSTELRGLTQAFSQTIIEQYGRPCRYNIGDSRCNRNNALPIWPDEIAANTAYAVGDVVRVRKARDDLVSLHAPGVTDADDDSQYAATGTLGANAVAADTTQLKNLAGNFRFTPPTFTENPVTAVLSYPDAAQYAIGAKPFTLEGWFYFEAIGDGSLGPVLASHYSSTGNQRGWYLLQGGPAETNEADTDQLKFWASSEGTSAAGVAARFPFKPKTNVFYHIALVRDERLALRAFINGVQIGETVAFAVNIYDSTEVLRVSSFNSAAGANRPFEGSVEDFRLTIGDAVYRDDFTAPGALASTFADTLDLTHDYNDTLYRVTTAGTTHASLPFIFHPSTGPDADTGATTLSVTAPSTFTRPAGSFVDDGFVTDMVIVTTGFTNGANNGTFRITGTVNPTSLTVTAASLVTETGDADEQMVQSNYSNGVVFAADPARRVGGEVLRVDSQSVVVIGPPKNGGLLTQALILQNAGFELSGPAGTYSSPADIVAWDVTQGTVEVQTFGRTGAFSCQLPTNWGGANNAIIEQTIDISSYASLIDAAGETITVSYYYNRESGTQGQIWVDYEFLDQNDTTISTTSNGSNGADPAGTWFQFSQQNTIPALTRKVKVIIEGGGATGEPRIDDLSITASFDDPNFPNGSFEYGVLTFDTGLNAGKSIEIKSYDAVTKTFTLYLPAPYPITVGDNIGVHIGCNRELSRCTALGNVINYGGFPFIPGDDEFLRYPDSPY